MEREAYLKLARRWQPFGILRESICVTYGILK